MATEMAFTLGIFLSYMTAILVWAFAWICPAKAAVPLKSMAAVILSAFFSCSPRMTVSILLVWMWLLMTIPGY